MIVKPNSVIASLRKQARARPLIDYEATRRALDERATKTMYKDWINVGTPGAPGFNSNWSNVDMTTIAPFEPLTGDGRNPAGYFRDRWGFVHIRGVVTNVSGIVSTPVFRLPSDLVPAAKEYFRSSFATNGVAGLSGTTFRYACSIEVDTLGDVRPVDFFTTTGTGGIKLLLLENIQFHAADRGAVS